MELTRIKINGFKSFIDPIEIPIKNGLTGIVGPNGCGKSNLFDALKWVMGESAYKNMRAETMDDVIFNGTQNKPQRNIAEVTIVLDNKNQTAPIRFNQHHTIEISRKIEREMGSVYQINKKNVRARDIITLFADVATGARSASLVAQGAIAQIIAAQPKERAKLLEEAAGITGIHARRHETEIKIKATKTNLIRIQENSDTIKNQLTNLKKQARQAKKYKKISENIQYLELKLIYNQYINAQENLKRQNHILINAEKKRDEIIKTIEKQTIEKQKRAQIIQNLKNNETVKQAKLNGLNNEKKQILEEQQRQKQNILNLENQRNQINQDIKNQQENANEAEQTIEKRQNEKKQLIEKNTSEKENIKKIAYEKKQINEKQHKEENEINQIQQKISNINAQKNALLNALQESQKQRKNLDMQENDTQKKWEKIKDEKTENIILNLQKDADNAKINLKKIEDNIEHINQNILKKRNEEHQARQQYLKHQNEYDRCRNDIDNIGKFLQQEHDTDHKPIIDNINVTPGYEKALAAALKDELNASTDKHAPAYWEILPTHNQTSMPQKTQPLEKHVKAPPELQKRLRYIGITDPDGAEEIQKKLMPGQKIVSLKGDMWRWDGYSTKEKKQNYAQKKLEEKNTLEKLKKNIPILEKNAENAKTNLQNQQRMLEKYLKEEKDIREKHRKTGKILDQALEKLNIRQKQNTENQKQETILKETRNQIKKAILQNQEQKQNIENQIRHIENIDRIVKIHREKEKILADIKKEAENKNNQYQKLTNEIHYREQRINHINNEIEEWNARHKKILNHINILKDRCKENQYALKNNDKPENQNEKIDHIEQNIDKEEKELDKIKTDMREQETKYTAIEQHEKNMQDQHLQILEDYTRAQERTKNIQENKHQTHTKLLQKLQYAKEDPENAAAEILRQYQMDNPQQDNNIIEDINHITQNLEKKYAEREKIGAVNLIAEEEAQKTEEHVNELEQELHDIEQALEKLQKALHEIKRQGKEKLEKAFEVINRHFQALFHTLFAGGQAKLIMTNTQDPLETELEIIAQPPGKQNQSISLLSGGEQTLTAIALTFALFLTNPSPICALDEIDAPLDDANVERFCNMLNDIEQKTKTRFLIITHHPYTMSKMHRLYGVTMVEKGVSRLVSVSLQQAQKHAQ